MARADIRRLEKARKLMEEPRNPLDIESVSRCELCINLGHNHVPSEGNPRADVMFIGQSPGAKEVEQGRPFCGPSGELLDLMLNRADLEREDVYIANTLKCRPPQNRAAFDGEIKNCRNAWLKHEIKHVNPRLIVLIGKDAFKSVLPPGKYAFEHKQKIDTPSGRSILICWHPAYLLRQGRPELFIEVGDRIRSLLDA